MRELLRSHQIDFHETDAGFLGIGTAAIWINKPEQLDNAKSLIAQYQLARYTNARSSYNERKRRGEQTRFIDLLRENPAKIIFYLGVAVLFLLVMTRPFWF